MFNEKLPFIFISYSHRDSDMVCPIIERLRKEGFNVWYDDGIEPGSEWDENIADHITQCSYFIAFISEHYLKSQNCKDELNFSRDLDKERLLVYLEDVSLSSGMAMRMNRNQAIYWKKCASVEQAYHKLFSAVGIEKTRVFMQKPAQQPMPIQQSVAKPMQQSMPQPVQQRPVQQPMSAQQPVPKPTQQQPAPAQQPVPKPVQQQPVPAQQPVPKPTQQQPAPAQQPVPKPTQQQPAPAQQPVPKPVQQPPAPAQQPTTQSAKQGPVQQARPALQSVPKPVQPKKSNTKSTGMKIGLIIAGVLFALLFMMFIFFVILIIIGSSASASDDKTEMESVASVTEQSATSNEKDADEMYNLGLDYFGGGNGVETDYEKSVYWLDKAADAGHYDAMIFLMSLYYSEHSPIERDFVKAMELADKILEQNPEDADAMFAKGYCYAYGGHGIEQDYDQAFEWLSVAAEYGNVDAMYNLAQCYFYGYGVEADQDKAVMWYQAYEDAYNN